MCGRPTLVGIEKAALRAHYRLLRQGLSDARHREGAEGLKTLATRIVTPFEDCPSPLPSPEGRGGKGSTISKFSSRLEESVRARYSPNSLSPWERGGERDSLAEENQLKNIALYFSMGGEVNTLPLAKHLDALGYTLALPVVQKDSRILSFHRWDIGTSLSTGAYGTSIPAYTEQITPDIILVPALSYTKEGYRLGYGGGYYDATLAAYPHAISIGVAYKEQLVEKLPLEDWDVPVQHLIWV
jgi:5,10-methenyltetrahydrofolate synthetase